MRLRAFIAVLILAVVGMIAGCVLSEGTRPLLSAETDELPAARFSLTSPAFTNGAPIPREYAAPRAGGRNASIPLTWDNAPDETQSFALEVFDTHPKAKKRVHWMVVDIPAYSRCLAIGASCSEMPGAAWELFNSAGQRGWAGVMPRIRTGVHRYEIRMWALDTPTVEIPPRATHEQFSDEVEDHAIAVARMVGTFKR